MNTTMSMIELAMLFSADADYYDDSDGDDSDDVDDNDFADDLNENIVKMGVVIDA